MAIKNMITLVLVFGYCISLTDSYKVLVTGDAGGGSHYYILERIAKTLAERDHDVTVYVSDMYRKQRDVPSLKFVVYESLVEMDDWEGLLTNITTTFLSGEDFWSQLQSQLKAAPLVFKLMRDQCHSALADKKLLKHLRNKNYDVVVGDFYYICASLVGQALDKPYLLIDCPMPGSWHYSINSNPVNPSYMPTVQTGLPNRMTFTQRLKNTYQIVQDYILKFSLLSDYDDLKKVHNIKPEISTYKGLNQAEIFFMNNDFTLDYARPLMPNTIPAGGILTGPAKPLDSVSKLFQISRFGRYVELIQNLSGLYVTLIFLQVAYSNDDGGAGAA